MIKKKKLDSEVRRPCDVKLAEYINIKEFLSLEILDKKKSKKCY